METASDLPVRSPCSGESTYICNGVMSARAAKFSSQCESTNLSCAYEPLIWVSHRAVADSLFVGIMLSSKHLGGVRQTPLLAGEAVHAGYRFELGRPSDYFLLERLPADQLHWPQTGRSNTRSSMMQLVGAHGPLQVRGMADLPRTRQLFEKKNAQMIDHNQQGTPNCKCPSLPSSCESWFCEQVSAND